MEFGEADKKHIKQLFNYVSVSVLLLIAVTSFGVPYYRVWQQRMEGEAELAKAQQNRQIAIAEAEAKKSSAKLHAEAEIERAKGVAEANRIIGESLTDHENYLRYLWITNLESGSGKEVIYIPTEAGLPILEATRLQQTKPQE